MSNALLKYDYAELWTRCRANSETDEGECGCLRILKAQPTKSLPLGREGFWRPFFPNIIVAFGSRTQSPPPWHADGIGAGWRIQTKGDGTGDQGHSQLYSSNFHVTHRFFGTFLTQENTVSPSFPTFQRCALLQKTFSSFHLHSLKAAACHPARMMI